MVMIVIKSLVLPVLAGGGFIALAWLLPPLRKWNWLSGAAFGLALAIGVFASFVLSQHSQKASSSGLASFGFRGAQLLSRVETRAQD